MNRVTAQRTVGLALIVGALAFSGERNGLRPNVVAAADSIPLPEHPRPDFQRAQWLNLNGRWQFAFDSLPSKREILVPFSWGSPLSGVPDSGDIGWYARDLTVPSAWRGRRVFLVFGASDWFEANEDNEWWHPWWLLLWKAACVTALAWLIFTAWRREHRAKGRGDTLNP